PHIPTLSVVRSDMLSCSVIQLLPSASHPSHSSSFSPSSMHSPTVFPRISSQGSSSLVKISPHLSQRIHQPLPREIKKHPAPKGGNFYQMYTSTSFNLFVRRPFFKVRPPNRIRGKPFVLGGSPISSA